VASGQEIWQKRNFRDFLFGASKYRNDSCRDSLRPGDQLRLGGIQERRGYYGPIAEKEKDAADLSSLKGHEAEL
jgi:hypothetical protein